MDVLEESRVALRLRRKTHLDLATAIVDGNVARVARARADTVERTAAAVDTVHMAVLADVAVVRIFGRRTCRLAVRTVLHVLTANTRCLRLNRTNRHSEQDCRNCPA